MRKPLTCNATGCGQEVHWGWRHGREAWWHREDVDHHVVLGTPAPYDVVAARLERLKEEEEPDHELEPVEVRRFDLPHKGRLFIGSPDGPPACAVVPGGVRTLLNLAKKVGWDVQRLTYARGPYLGANGKSLGVSDSVVLHLRGPVVDGRHVFAVASWRDGKSDSVWRIVNNKLERLGARALSEWMKETPASG